MATPAPIFNPRKRPRQAMIAEPQMARGPGPSGAASYPDLMPPNFQQQQQQWPSRYPSSGRGAASMSNTNWGTNQQTTNNQSMNRDPSHSTGARSYTSSNNRGQPQQSSSSTSSYTSSNNRGQPQHSSSSTSSYTSSSNRGQPQQSSSSTSSYTSSNNRGQPQQSSSSTSSYTSSNNRGQPQQSSSSTSSYTSSNNRGQPQHSSSSTSSYTSSSNRGQPQQSTSSTSSYTSSNNRGQPQHSSSSTSSYGTVNYGSRGQTGKQASLPPVGRTNTANANGAAGASSNWKMQGHQSGQGNQNGGRYGGLQGHQSRYGGPQGHQSGQGNQNGGRYGGPQGHQSGQATGSRYSGPNTSSYQGDTGRSGWNSQVATFKGNNSQAPTTNRYNSNNNSSSNSSMRGGFQPSTINRPTGPSYGITQSQLANTNWDDPFPQTTTSKPAIKTQQTKWSLKKSPEQDKGLHVVTVSILDVKKWNNHKATCQMMFEIYGYLDSAVSKSLTGCREFILRDDNKNALSCVFFEIDRHIPKMLRGQWQRVIGNYDEKASRLRCVSVRTVIQDERNFSQTLINTSSQYLTRVLQQSREP